MTWKDLGYVWLTLFVLSMAAGLYGILWMIAGPSS